MRRVDRTRLLIKVIERLAKEEWPTIDLIVGQFEGKRRDDWQGSTTAYVTWSLENVANDSLLELGEFFGLSSRNSADDAHELGVTELSAIKRIWGEKSDARIFLSHCSSFSIEAGKLKENLRLLGISSFVAHTDIQPSKEWRQEIQRALKTMDVLAPLLTSDFHLSEWTDQEVGIGVNRGVPIISLKYGLDPYGFLEKYQALPCANQEPHQVAFNMALFRKPVGSAETGCLYAASGFT